ncbi:Uncharacterised protein [Mycobacteroides abscessus subsp. abscessus]|nr:Uncharacterised protein [Mycobacteroides abscessus]SHX50803.1 Uncharacterised protein [Mycobacteroides abscessus subsp. abscessus]
MAGASAMALPTVVVTASWTRKRSLPCVMITARREVLRVSPSWRKVPSTIEDGNPW